MLHSNIIRIETHHSGTPREKPVMRTILDKVHKIWWIVHCKRKEMLLVEPKTTCPSVIVAI
jgi:hypothetical protein